MNSKELLNVLKKTGRTTAILLSMFLGEYHNSYRRIRKKLLYPTLPDFSEYKKDASNIDYKSRNKRRFYSVLNQLKKQGFISKGSHGKETFWEITEKGIKHIEKFSDKLNLPKRNYKKEKNDGLIIVVFDIPEKYRHKRNWIRQSLISLEFNLLQKSVWIGKNKIPQTFLKDMAELGIIDDVHIFSVIKAGTIKNFS